MQIPHFAACLEAMEKIDEEISSVLQNTRGNYNQRAIVLKTQIAHSICLNWVIKDLNFLKCIHVKWFYCLVTKRG